MASHDGGCRYGQSYQVGPYGQFVPYPCACTRDPAAIATEHGHTVTADPPGHGTALERWTCTACTATVIRYGRNIYGTATTTTCKDNQ